MAVRQVATTDSLDKLRIEFNALALSDFGDIATLDASLSATTVIGAVNEINGIAIAAAGFTLTDGQNSQAVASGNTLTVSTTTGITALVSAPDTLTLGINTDLTGINTIDVATSVEIGDLTLSSGSIIATGGAISFGNENLTTTGGITGGAIVGTGLTINGAEFLMEGATSDAFATTIRVTDPTAANTITIPDISGTVITTADTGTVTQTMLANSAVSTDQIADASITIAKLKDFPTSTLTVDTLIANNITGLAATASQVALTADNSTNATRFITFSDNATGNNGLKTDTDFYYNPSTNTLTTTSTQANYADLAEKYLVDKEYEVGTVLCIGGTAEVTQCKDNHCSKVVGVVSEKPAFIMNGSLEGMSVAVALTGRVSCKVCGPVKKGDMIVSCEQAGCGRAEAEPRPGTLIGKSLVNDDSTGERLVEIVVGK
jgi:hypothetical protein